MTLINHDTKVIALGDLINEHQLEVRITLCAAGYCAVVTKRDDGASWSHVATTLWQALDVAFKNFIDWEKRQ